MSCEAGARASIHLSKAPSSLGKRPRNLARSPLQVGSRRKKFNPHNARFSPLILAYKGSAPTPLVRGRSSYSPSSSNLACTHQQTICAVTCLCELRHPLELSATISPASRVPHAPEGHHIGVMARRTGRNRPDTTKLPPLVNQPAGSGRHPVGVTSRGRIRP